MLKLSIKLDYIDFLRFNLMNNFTKGAGMVSLIISVVCLFLGTTNANYTFQDRLYMYIIAVFALLWLPCFLMYKSNQVAKSPTFAKPLEYEFSDYGFKVSQNYNHREFSWADIKEVSDTKHLIVLHTHSKEVYIIPKAKIFDKYKALTDLLSNNLAKSNI